MWDVATGARKDKVAGQLAFTKASVRSRHPDGKTHAKICGRARIRTYRLAEGGDAHWGEGGGGAGEGKDNG